MAITAKEIAKILGISPAAVSIAINNKPGVSSATRERVLQLANENGYEFSRGKNSDERKETISFILYKKSGGSRCGRHAVFLQPYGRSGTELPRAWLRA